MRECAPEVSPVQTGLARSASLDGHHRGRVPFERVVRLLYAWPLANRTLASQRYFRR